MTQFYVWLGLGLGNLLFTLVTDRNFKQWFDRTYYQGVAILVVSFIISKA